MKKITILIVSALFALTTSAFAVGGMVGVKLGQGYLEGNANSYTSGTNAYPAESGTKGSPFGAIFAEVNIQESPVSVGIEYVPFDADISLNGQQNTVSANVDHYTTVYLLAMHELAGFNVYAKLGYSQANIATVIPNDAATTVNSQSDSLEGIMGGFGFQSQELPFGLVARAEYTLTQFDQIQITTTSNGSTSVSKSADGDLTAVTLSLAKSF